ncbi:MAG: metal ABC transporter substrate-binding protein [Eubacteriales bacterium]
MSKNLNGYFKRGLALIMVLAVVIFMLTACGETPKDNGKFKIVCTTFPSYDWISQLTKDIDGIELSLLQDDGVDLHSYQPTADDMIRIKESNLFVYVGGESDDWVEDAIDDIDRNDFKSVNLMQILGDNVKMEEVKEGMELHHHHDHDADEHDEHHDADEHDEHHDADEHDEHHDADEHDEHHDADEHDEHEHCEKVENDEHIWLSLKNAQLICSALADKLAESNPENASKIKENEEKYLEKLAKLDQEYEEVVASAQKKTLLFGDRFPFRYLVDDYGLDYFAAFVGCSAETEASFETVAFLANKLDDLKLDAVMTIDKSDKKIAQTIVESSKGKSAKILTMNSMQTVDSKQIKDGATYLKIMKDNLNVLKEALN